ncbi:hypothetical protein L208DRAFT_1398868 [Tricholoma matsutake]|nr:hypothetical protein L208DRAFT_1398868 [Tricholoma matsutake 945]
MLATNYFQLLALFTVSLVNAQNSTTSAVTPSSSADLSSCLISCVSAAAANSPCTTFSNVTCVCTSAVFQQLSSQCLNQNCTQADATQAVALQKSQCGALSTGAGSSTTAPASTASGTHVSSAPSTNSTTAKPSNSASTTTQASASTTSKSAAEQKKQALGIVGALVASVLALVL